MDFFDTVNDTYGLDVDAPLPSDEGNVIVPEIALHLSGEDFARLQQEVDPLGASGKYGMDLYQQTLQFISSLPH